MSKIYSFFIVFYIFGLPILQGQPITFNRTYDTSTRLSAVTQTVDKGYFGVGFGNPEIMYAIKTDSLGNMQWQHSFTNRRTSQLYAVTTTQDGNVVCLGGIIATPTYQYGFMPYAIKYDMSGRILWERTYMPTIFPQNGLGNNIIEMSNGNLAFCGTIVYDVSRGLETGYVLQTNAQGQELWRYTFPLDSINKFTPREIDKTVDDGIVMLSASGSLSSQLLKLNAQGQLQWHRTFSTGYSIYWSRMLVLPNGNIALGGSGFSGPNSITWGIHFAIFSATGDLIRHYILDRGNTYNMGTREMVLNRDKTNIMLLGVYSNANYAGINLLRLNLAGDSLNYFNYEEARTVNLEPRGIAATADNGFVICGMKSHQILPSWLKPWILKMDSTGTIRNHSVGTQTLNYKLPEWSVYPNPIHTEHYLKGDFQALLEESADTPIELQWVDVLGRIIKQQSVSISQIATTVFDVQHLASGTYFLVIRQGSHYLGAKKIVLF